MHQAHVHNNDIVAAGITSMVIPCIALLLFTVEYFLLVLWPGKLYSRAYNRWKGGIFVAASVGMVATAVVSTVRTHHEAPYLYYRSTDTNLTQIFVATRSASISGVDATAAQQLTSMYFRPPLSKSLHYTHSQRKHQTDTRSIFRVQFVAAEHCLDRSAVDCSDLLHRQVCEPSVCQFYL